MSSSAVTLETPSFTDLNTIKPFKTTWRIQVKIVHSWKQYNTYVGESLDMILSDISGTLIHATVKKQQVSKFQRLVVPGEWRIIENFTLSKAMGRFRATKHVYRMSLMNTTSIVPCASLSEDMYLELVDFATVLNDPSLDENLLIDVIGQVVNVGELTTHDVANKTKKKLEFELRDSKDERLVCTLWDNFAEEMLAVCEKKRGKTFICLLRFAKVNSFKGERSISNAFDMSLLQIDPDLPEANKFRERLPKDGLSLTIKRGVPKEEKKVRKADFYKRFPSLTIAELIDITEEGKYKIMCTVYAIDTEFAWYYFVCLKCNTTVYKVPKVEDDVVKTNKKAIFWCSGCQQYHSKVEPRFKLILCVMDSTGQTKCVLFESDAQMIVYQSAVQLLNGELEEIQDPNNIPQSLQNLVGKTFQFVVSVEKVHIRDRKDTYKVSHAFLGTDIEKANAYEAPEDDDLITIVSGDQEPPTLSSSIENGELPCTPSTTPSSKRKDEASAESSDDSSSSKKVCVESIAKAIDDEHVEGDEGNE